MDKTLVLTSWLDVLEWIAGQGQVSTQQLAEHFKYSRGYASVVLSRLKHRKLLINMTVDCWELTENGYGRLRLYHRR